MNREELAAYLTDTYSVEGEHLFAKYPSFLVFRHSGNKKWFAVIMDIPRKNLGLTGDGEISVVNLKCDPRLIGSFREEPSIFPGWHMNKAHWLSVALDGTVENEKIRFLVDMSYELTKKWGCKETACEKRRIPGMGSSVDIFCVFCLWNTFYEKSERTNHILRKLWISWGCFSDIFQAFTPLFALPASADGTCKG